MLTAHAELFPQKLILYYDINKTIPVDNFAALDSLLSKSEKQYYGVSLVGFADFLHNERYNKTLSLKRAQRAKEHLLKSASGFTFNIREMRAEGERFSKESSDPRGEQAQRKVEITFEPALKEPVTQGLDKRTSSPAPEKNSAKKPADNSDQMVQQKERGLDDLEILQSGDTFALEGLGFVPGRHQFLPQSVPVLEKLLSTMQDHPTLKIEIQGHVCCTPGDIDAFDEDSGNKKLSENRAKAVYDYLRRNKISADRLRYKGFAHSRLKVPEISPENEQINRRVEIFILEK
jgi:outer membrane protein OmpA-like peptidoglycan-associated protein